MKQSQRLIMIYMTVKRKETKPYLKLETFSMKAVSSVMMRCAIMQFNTIICSNIQLYICMNQFIFVLMACLNMEH